jgi:NAD(P)H-hydrate epimerase
VTELPIDLYRASQVRELDRCAIEDFSIPGYTLMQRAGQAAFDILRKRWPDAHVIQVVVGPGNNGGDGYVIAHLARQAGLSVKLFQLGDPERIRGDALSARMAYVEDDGQIQTYEGQSLADCDVVVDALFGTGLEREITGHWRGVIEAINALSVPVLSVDIPSGLHSDNGVVLGVVVRAQCTVTYIGLKQGQFTGAAADCCGEIYFDDLQVPAAVYDTQKPSARRIQLQQYIGLLAPRERNSNKGRFGHVLVIGGQQGMSGAVRMAGEAAARTGAGLVSVATREVHAPFLNLAIPELMVKGVESVEALTPLLEQATVIAIGPGLAQTNWSRMLLQAVLNLDLPMVIDADALNLLSHYPVRGKRCVLTPHPGEAARLLATDVDTIQRDRYSAAISLQQRYDAVCVLKGAGTVVSSKDRITVCGAGNPGMASGGMGDVLTGVIAGLLAQGLPLVDAAEMGVCLHAVAGDAVAEESGERGMLATDLLPHLHRLVNP